MSSASSLAREAARDIAIVVVAAVLLVGVADRLTQHAGTAVREPTHLVAKASVESPPPADPAAMRVCADPNNLPFSNHRREGFENAIADVVAADLGKHVEYYWQPQRRGFLRTTLNAGWCDVVIGVAAGIEMARTTRPYYRSAYVFVSRRDHGRPLESLDDERLRRMRIGVQMTGEDYDNPPALQALARRRITDNVRGYLVYGDYSQPNPARRVIDAVASGDLDTAIVWGPLAGYFARSSRVPLDLRAVAPRQDGPALPFAFDIAMAVRRRDRDLHDAIDAALGRRGAEIQRILVRFGVPLLEREGVS